EVRPATVNSLPRTWMSASNADSISRKNSSLGPSTATIGTLDGTTILTVAALSEPDAEVDALLVAGAVAGVEFDRRSGLVISAMVGAGRLPPVASGYRGPGGCPVPSNHVRSWNASRRREN